ncbi:hypothetical protein HYFRA_00001928 [Hymenoscyphus fraxineus]|uniref:Rhodopsin domain-containing protein n=1 Tax=Hymenoscyphus fraxineus TaxID=746836 RepID=A0A9N9KJM3_9HELO|nr:hypothetical protein HYFRA_00001928 [Hymenoscyphus fraxineus]
MAQLDIVVGGVVSLCAVFLVLTTTTLILRFFARSKQAVKIGIDDWIILAAWVFFVGETAIMFYGVSQGIFGHTQPKDKKVVAVQHVTLEKLFITLDGLCVMTLGVAKISALFFYRRIFCSAGRLDFFNIATAFFIVVVAIWTVVFFVMTFRLCGRHGVEWIAQPGNTAKCSLIYPYFAATTISDVVLDVLILGLPIPKIWTLKATIGRRLAVSGVFLLALVGLAASLTRMINTLHLVKNGREKNSKDGYQTNTQNAYYMILEAGFTIVAVNLPSLWYFTAGVSPERVLRSIRSMASLNSGRSSQDSSKRNQNAKDHARDASSGERSLDDTASILNKHGADTVVETYAMVDVESGPRKPDGIHVERNFHRSEAHV